MWAIVIFAWVCFCTNQFWRTSLDWHKPNRVPRAWLVTAILSLTLLVLYLWGQLVR